VNSKALSDSSRAAVPGGVQVIARVAELFRALDGEPWGLTLTQLATRLELPRSTVHRLVGALATEGLLTSPAAAGRVRIGPEFARIASNSRLELRQQLEPLMRRVFDAIGETVDCAVLEGDQVRVQAVISTQHQLRAVAEVGVAFPLHCTSKGKALLAELDDDGVLGLLPGRLERFTPNTIVSRPKLLAEIAEVRRTGVAFDLEEHNLGICAVAIAARDPFGSLFCVSMPVPSQRFAAQKDAIVRALLEVRDELTEMLSSS
jgi:DNA-binding IclR family transcriptional regulator